MYIRNDRTHVFDIGAWVNSDDVAMLDAEVMSDHPVHAGTAIIQIIVCKYDQDRILALLSFH